MEGLKHAKLTCIFVCNHWKLQLQGSRVHGLVTAKFFAVSIKDLKRWQCWGGRVALTFFAFQPAQLHLPTATCQNTEAKTLPSGERCFSQEVRGEIGSKNIPKSHKQWQFLDHRIAPFPTSRYTKHRCRRQVGGVLRLCCFTLQLQVLFEDRLSRVVALVQLLGKSAVGCF